VSRRLFVAVLIPLLVLGLLAAGWGWLMRTSAGAEFLLQRATAMMTALRWERLEGDLRQGITLHGVELEETGLRASLTRAQLALRVSWLPRPEVDIVWLRFFDGELQIAASEETAPGPGAFTLPDLSSPLAVQLRELQVRNLAVHLPNREADPLQIERLDLAARFHRDLELQSLDLAMPDLEATVSGVWSLSQPFDGNLRLDADLVRPDLQQRIEARIAGDPDGLGIDLALRGPASVSGRVELESLLDKPSASVDLSGRLGDWPGLDLAIDVLSISGSGNLDAWTAVMSGRATRQDWPSNRFDLELSGNRERAELQQGQIEMLDGTVDLAGEIDLAEAVRARLALSVDALDLSSLYPDWPKLARLSGRARLDASQDRLIVESFEVSAPPAALQLTGQGRWLQASEELSVTLNWSELDWPPVLDQRQPLLQSRGGTARIAGSPGDWRLELEALLRLRDQPESRVLATARGDTSSADIQSLRIDAGAAGTGRASGRLRWVPERSGQLALKISDFDFGAYVPELPGRIDAELVLEALWMRELVVELKRLEGRLRDQPVSGQGHVSLSDDSAAAGRLQFALGDNQLRLDSANGRLWRFDVDAGHLAQVLPGASGRLSAGGRIDLDAGRAALQAELDSGWLGDTSLQQARLDATLDFIGDRPSGQLRLNLAGLDVKDWDSVDTLELSMDGDCLAHQLKLDLATMYGTLDLMARGGLNVCRWGQLSAWSGTVETMAIDDTPAGRWWLQQPLTLSVTRERVLADAACLVESRGLGGRFCLRGLDIGTRGQAAVGLEQVPMDLLLVPFDLGFTLTSNLSGELEASWRDGSTLESIAGHLQVDRGHLQPLVEDDDLLDLVFVRLDLTPEAEFLRVTLEALVEGDSRLSGQAQIADLQDPGSAVIDAQARLDLPDIGVFLRLVPELDQLGGRLGGEVRASGALLGPRLTGQLRLDDGLAVHAPLDLRMEDVVVTLDLTENSASLRKSMRGGEGTLALSSDLTLVEEQWQFDTRLKGERFRLSDVHWLRLSASPDIRLSRSADGLLSIDGDIRIDELRAGMPPGSEQRINASPDRHVYGESGEDDPGAGFGRRLQGRLGLDLGQDARTSALGMQASLAGILELLWDGESSMPSARGVISIPRGSYQAYGQNLQIYDGQVMFTGKAIDNPGLDVNAIREIFGDPRVQAAGVRIRGSARNPRITLFTDPPTSQEMAMSYLLAGTNLGQVDSQAAISIGLYLLPRLFVSYGIGLFEAGNVLAARYELSRRWGIRAVSGDRETGIDFSLAIDR